jgi:hypothetical protein
MNYDPGSNRMRSAPGWREGAAASSAPIVDPDDRVVGFVALFAAALSGAIAVATIAVSLAWLG